jgi:hypothetical protein
MRIKTATALIVILFIICQLIPTDIMAAASESYSLEEIMQLMLDFQHSDGAYTEKIVSSLEKALRTSPNAFLQALLFQETSYQDQLIFYTTYYPFWDGDEEVAATRSALLTLKHSQLSSEENDVTRKLIEAFESNGRSFYDEAHPPYFDPFPKAIDSVMSLYIRGIIPKLLMNKYEEQIYRDEFIELIINTYSYACPEIPYYSSPFIDISESLFKSSIEKAYTLKIIDGTSANRFSPHLPLTREQAAKILFNLILCINKEELSLDYKPRFLDRDEISEWAIPYVGYCQQYAIMPSPNWYMFYPKDSISRETAMALIERLIQESAEIISPTLSSS